MAELIVNRVLFNRALFEDTGSAGLLAFIKFLVSAGCDPSQCDANGHPPVYFAVLEGYSLLDAALLAPRDVRDELLSLLTNILL
ncbi:hypothetical protein HD554DRAFT_2173253 [Boletus coccyginus]|nr:hypothetical protein HD554DRAFT_2173253 [Boletus coccyginus]